MKSFLSKNQRWIPLLLLGVCVGTYGVYLSQLGFYWDDWLHIYQTQQYNNASSFFNFNDRPMHAWLDVFSRAVLGLKPLHWHLFTLVLRWLTAWSMWEILIRMWPQRKEQMTWTAILYSVYPVFQKQSAAVIYRAHFFTTVCFFLSVLFMIQAYRKRKAFWPYTILGMLTTLCHLFTTEYMAGLEIIRPVILWIIISPQIEDWREKLKTVAKNWFPYLLVIIIFIIRRFIFYQGESDPNPLIGPGEQGGLVPGLLDLAIVSFRDVLYVLVTSITNTFLPEEIIDISPGNILAVTVSVVIGVGVYFVMKSCLNNNSSEKIGDRERHVILFGLFSVFVGLIPVWLTGNKVIAGPWADRFGIPAMFGASIFLIALISLLIPQINYRRIVISILLGLAISTQIRSANVFRWDWVRQTRAYWQMYWRAPGIEPNTPMIADGALTGYVNRYNAAFALNMLYPQDENTDLETYWYFEITYNGLYRYIPELLAGKSMKGQYQSEVFLGESKNSLIIETPELEDQCLWFLTPRDKDNNKILEEARELTPIINLDRILPEPVSDDYPNEAIFGPEPKRGWCYFFQKASLARQFEDWEAINRLWEEAKQLGFQTEYTYELLPFIEAFVYLEDLDQAVDLSVETQQTGMHKNLMLCASWEGLGDSFGGIDEFDQAYAEVVQELNCP